MLLAAFHLSTLIWAQLIGGCTLGFTDQIEPVLAVAIIQDNSPIGVVVVNWRSNFVIPVTVIPRSRDRSPELLRDS
jgi:hypothetical protein